MRFKPIIIAVILAVFVLSFVGCASSEDDNVINSAYTISYLNRDNTKIIKKPYEPYADLEDSTALVSELLDVMSSDSGDLEYIRAIPEGVTIDKTSVDNGRLSIFFDNGYTGIDSVREILCRLALVQTLTQIEGINSISIYVDGEPLCDARGYAVGAMTIDSFVENPGEQIDSIQRASITLFFANSTGDGLKGEVQNVYYSANTSLEKLVIERLIKGPVTEDTTATLPEGTALVNVSVADRVCYVSFNEAFLTQNYDLTEETIMYSVINSLTNLSHIDKVQISVNGDTSATYRDSMSLADTYGFDKTIVKDSSSLPEVIVDNTSESNQKN